MSRAARLHQYCPVRKALYIVVMLAVSGCCPRHPYPVPYVEWSAVRDSLASELSGLDTDFERVNHLHMFAARHLNLGDPELHYSSQGIFLDRLSAGEIYTLFALDCVTTFCGGAAVFLQKVLEEFGYTSSLYDMGNSNTKATHVVLITTIHDAGEAKRIVQDPYLNTTIVCAKNGSPIDFRDVIKHAAADNFSEIATVNYGYEGKTLVRSPRHLGHWNLSNVPIKFYRSAHRKNWCVLSSPRHMSQFLSLKVLRKLYCDFLESEGRECNYLSLFLYPLPHNDPSLVNEVNQLKNSSTMY